jgi:hypothetical protein
VVRASACGSMTVWIFSGLRRLIRPLAPLFESNQPQIPNPAFRTRHGGICRKAHHPRRTVCHANTAAPVLSGGRYIYSRSSQDHFTSGRAPTSLSLIPIAWSVRTYNARRGSCRANLNLAHRGAEPITV